MPKREVSSRAKALALQGLKYCCGCKDIKQTSDFHKCRNRFDGLNSTCMECRRVERKPSHRSMWGADDVPYKKPCQLQATCWTKEDYITAYRYQQGICAVEGCHGPASTMDHNHETGRPRALLCGNCNKALGLLADDVNRIIGLAKYVVDHGGGQNEANTS